MARASELIEAGEVGALDPTDHREVLAALLEAPAITLADAVIDNRREI
ncbi:hypothetical protein HWD35_22075 [Tsukamurella tyrosinosolvens]|uniref:Uncharacterized protein n=1 Tax=Tsukamurella columbiensis TaxID=128509 RepID=A0ABX1LHR6_9ACTN|nr:MULTISPECIES: hypothetical protein [Tsukamurella]MCA4997418.1 hypothetical protein [Tsukamurella tyrosinosolvens]NMD56995.1 hypothetical protein [Tsukamurella columbiensis]